MDHLNWTSQHQLVSFYQVGAISKFINTFSASINILFKFYCNLKSYVQPLIKIHGQLVIKGRCVVPLNHFEVVLKPRQACCQPVIGTFNQKSSYENVAVNFEEDLSSNHRRRLPSSTVGRAVTVVASLPHAPNDCMVVSSNPGATGR